jgi:predicted ester cyclase
MMHTHNSVEGATKVKALTVFVMSALVLAGCAGQHRDLVPLGKQTDAYVNAHNIDGFAGMLAGDAVAKAPDGTMHKGKDSVKAWMGGMMSGFHVDSRGWQQSGDTLSWMSTVRSDAYAAMGVNPLKVNTMAVFAGDKIHYFQANLDEETAGKMRFLQFYNDVVNGGNIDAIDKYVAMDMIDHQAVPPGTPKGLAGVKWYFKMIHEAFPDLHGTPSLVLADGDKVLIYATWEGTNKGRFMGKSATNKKTSWGVVDIIRLVDGKAVEHWGWEDMTGAM